MTNKYAYVFPGQGSQSVGMLAEMALQYPEVQQTFALASAVLNYDLWQLVSHGPAEALNQTDKTQPALLAASYAIWQIAKRINAPQPSILAGHSLGEYTALVCAESLRFEDGIKLVAARGEFMQQAVAAGVGAMAAIIGLDDAAVAAICIEVSREQDMVSPANFNSVGQVVVAGHKAAVDRAIVIAKEKGAAMAVLIPVSVPSHCELMRPAAQQLAVLLETINFAVPQVPVLNNVDVTLYQSADDIRAGLTKQLYKPVRWVETIQAFVELGVTHVFECGPGKVLSGLNKRINKSLQLITAANIDTLVA
jgi:[acyl-carrier-protein] S-malonyltransferase